jgi:dTDP-4-amino-4,6-dideoxygalactose transaminase
LKVPFVDLNKQYLPLREEIDSAFARVIQDSSFIRGPEIEIFETNFARSTGVKHCISCANGTDALYIAMKALGLGAEDEVITTAHSWISTSETITQTGAKVVFCDTNENDCLIDVSKIEQLITSKTKGIIPVHLFGQAVDIDPLLEITKKHNLWVIEDCAQAHFATYNGKTVGTFGDAATFSFYPGKNLGAMGDAGCIVTNRDDIADHMKLFARHGGKGEHLIEGINSRMDGLQAAVLNIKLSKMDEWTDKRRKAAQYYNELLQSIPSVTLPIEKSGNKHVYHLYVIKVPNRDELKKFLEASDIQTVINYPKALPFYKAYDYLEHVPQDFPVAYENQSKIISLPIHPFVEEKEQEYVAEKIHGFFQQKKCSQEITQ